MAQSTLIVVDNFYPDPRSVRERAIKMEFGKYEALGHYPGLISQVQPPDAWETGERIVGYLGKSIETLRPHLRPHFGRFRVIRGTDRPQCLVHAHRNEWSGLVYLNPPEQCQGGLIFYRSEKFGQYLGLDEPDMIYQPAGSRILGAWGPTEEQMLDPAEWTEVTRVQMVFNRLVIFRATQYHSFSPGFGETVGDCRLTQNFDFP